MKFNKIIILFIFLSFIFLKGCAVHRFLVNFCEGKVKERNDKLISIAIFKIAGNGLSYNEKEEICNYVYSNLRKINGVEVMQRDTMKLKLFKYKFPLTITNVDSAIEAGKLLEVDKVLTSLCGNIVDPPIISVKFIDVEKGKIDTMFSCQSSKEEILDNIIPKIKQTQKDQFFVKDIGNKGLWITLGTAIVGGAVTILVDIKAKDSPKQTLPEPSNFQ